MVNKDDALNTEYVKYEKNVLKLKVLSRHISPTTYRYFLRHKLNSIGVAGLTHYACECANGRRTVGCCTHFAAIVHYLSYAKYTVKNKKNSQLLKVKLHKFWYVLLPL